jgi:hypothetical protein
VSDIKRAHYIDGENALSPGVDHVARAKDHKRSHREASGRMVQTNRAIGDLFGPALLDHLTRRLEDLAEHGSEAIYHLEERIREIEDREAQMVRALTGKIEEQRHQLARLYAFAGDASGEFHRRAVRSGKPVPEFVSEYDSWLFQTNGPF